MKELVVRRLVYSCFHQEIQLLRQNRCLCFQTMKNYIHLKHFSFNAIINVISGRPKNQDRFV